MIARPVMHQTIGYYSKKIVIWHWHWHWHWFWCWYWHCSLCCCLRHFLIGLSRNALLLWRHRSLHHWGDPLRGGEFSHCASFPFEDYYCHSSCQRTVLSSLMMMTVSAVVWMRRVLLSPAILMQWAMLQELTRVRPHSFYWNDLTVIFCWPLSSAMWPMVSRRNRSALVLPACILFLRRW